MSACLSSRLTQHKIYLPDRRERNDFLTKYHARNILVMVVIESMFITHYQQHREAWHEATDFSHRLLKKGGHQL
jgi:hypothetical protein